MTGLIAGIDGCPGGWLAAIRSLSAPGVTRLAIYSDFATLLAAEGALAAIAVDMPIGLPARILGPGRGAEQAVRAGLGPRQSSLFAIPARAAIEASSYAEACRLALARSEPPRKVAKQAFNLFPKILEIDRALRAEPARAEVVIETHPEVIFARLQGAPLIHSKKSAEGAALRRALLAGAGINASALAAAPPRGAKADDLLDALACSLVAERYLAGKARPHPDPPERDPHGLRIAIWV